ncbi:MAG TPA: YdcF family protein [Thermoanaerobaculia bacterium]|nr:YdcF family protein [Thermoanaerobaculia bacterium]
MSHAKSREAMTTIGIVCGYDDLHTLRGYMSHLAPEIDSAAPTVVVLSGSVTSPDANASEAEVMADLLAELLPGQPSLIEDQAMTTLENLVNSKALAQRTFGRVERWIVFCDATHRTKVSVLARLILGPRVRIISVPRRARFYKRIVEPVLLVVEAIIALVPRLQPAFRLAAVRWRGVTHLSSRA